MSATCRRLGLVCLTVGRWVPFVFIFAVSAWSVYAYIVELVVGQVSGVGAQIVLLFFYAIFFTLYAWSYYKIVFTTPLPVPDAFQLSPSEWYQYDSAEPGDAQTLLRRLVQERRLPVYTRTKEGFVRVCESCQLIKPDRSHHCSVLGRCILKMDHYCPWTNNTVSFNNYKYFVLFLFYAFLYCVYVSATSSPFFIQFWTGLGNAAGSGDSLRRFQVMFLFLISIMFAIAVAGLLGYHVYLTLINQTTLESMRAPILLDLGSDKRAYFLGYRRNFEQVFGEPGHSALTSVRRFLPVYTTLGDGCRFPTRVPMPNGAAPPPDYNSIRAKTDAELGLASGSNGLYHSSPADQP